MQCCNEECLKWRYLPDVNDPAEVPERWVCNMNTSTLSENFIKLLMYFFLSLYTAIGPRGHSFLICYPIDIK